MTYSYNGSWICSACGQTVYSHEVHYCGALRTVPVTITTSTAIQHEDTALLRSIDGKLTELLAIARALRDREAAA